MYNEDMIQRFINQIGIQFRNRTVTEGSKKGIDYGVSLAMNVDQFRTLWLAFSNAENSHNVTIPLPFIENNVEFICQNEVVRALSPFWIEETQSEINYTAAMYKIIFDDPTGIIPKTLMGGTPYLQQVINSFRFGTTSIVIYRLQKAINDVINRMPLHETMMNSFIMNQRLMIVDPEFTEGVTSPQEKLNYQVNKARKYFNNSWTPIGLSDGSLSEKNYLLKTDLRKLSPFGLRYHNPQRNLYSTLGMKGDEYPMIRSSSAQALMDNGITRKGWNWFTAFVDIPDVFEDQIIVDRRHSNKFVEYTKRYQIFGKLSISEGQKISTGQVIGECPDMEIKRFEVPCEEATVSKIIVSETSIGGTVTPVYNVVITYKRFFKDAFKVTNMHGNKGEIRLMDLGFAFDPITGKRRQLDVIVGAKTVGKRKNYGQILEALVNTIREADGLVGPLVIADDWYQPNDEIYAGLEKRGFRRNGTWDCDTYVGKLKAVCGNVFWGVIKTPEDQLWKEDATVVRNGKEVRTAGLKFSHVEFRALETRFGVDNPVTDEIMSYMQGNDNINEMLDILRSKKGEYPSNKTVLNINSVRPVDQQSSTIISGQHINGTIVDEFFMPEGFLMKLPANLHLLTMIDEKGDITYEGPASAYENMSADMKCAAREVYVCEKLYIPSGILRKCWRHDAGKYGLSEIGVLVNNVVTMAHRLNTDPNNSQIVKMYYDAVINYHNQVAKSMGSKTGEIATHGMSVRYPFSAKAVATLSTTLPKNTVEIHRSMADFLKVKNGDVVVVERFPCLGFMSVRPQKIMVTDDPMCRYTIRASGNSLVSTNLDFDGDVIYLASFHTPEAKLALTKEWTNPNKTCYGEISALNSRKGAPHVKEYTLQDFNITPFNDLTNEEHAVIVEKNTGVKAQTGPVIALTYNIMRIVENSDLAKSHKMKVAIEMFLEKAAQSVFEQKHGGKSLYEIVIDGVCTADVEMLVGVGFNRGTTEKLCELIKMRAKSLGIFDLTAFHNNIKEKGGSNLISRIVREQNRIYFASRALLHPTALLNALDAPAVDIPSKMFKRIMSGKNGRIKTMLEEFVQKDSVDSLLFGDKFKDAVCGLFDVLDTVCNEGCKQEAVYPNNKNLKLAYLLSRNV